MSKIRLSLNKETLTIIIAGVTLLIVVIMNIVIILPTFFKVYEPTEKASVKAPIDTVIVNKALELLEESTNK